MKNILDFNLTQQQYMRLAKGSYLLPFYIFTPLALIQIVIGVFAYHIPLTTALALLGLGFLFWGVQEYVLHRFPFHSNFKHGLIKFVTSGFHNLHHQIPQSKEYIVTPFYFALLSQLVSELFFYVVTGNLASMCILGAGLAIGYMY